MHIFSIKNLLGIQSTECGRNGQHGRPVTSLVPMVPDSGPENVLDHSTMDRSAQDRMKRSKSAFRECVKVSGMSKFISDRISYIK